MLAIVFTSLRQTVRSTKKDIKYYLYVAILFCLMDQAFNPLIPSIKLQILPPCPHIFIITLIRVFKMVIISLILMTSDESIDI